MRCLPAIFPEEGLDMTKRQKVILRYVDGKLEKGYFKDSSAVGVDVVSVEDESHHVRAIKLEKLKAIFYVKDFDGDKKHRELKSFTGKRQSGKRVFLRFKDGESITGYLEGDTPWEKGFFLEAEKNHGFFLVPVDEASNNTKMFVVTSAVRDVAEIG